MYLKKFGHPKWMKSKPLYIPIEKEVWPRELHHPLLCPYSCHLPYTRDNHCQILRQVISATQSLQHPSILLMHFVIYYGFLFFFGIYCSFTGCRFHHIVSGGVLDWNEFGLGHPVPCILWYHFYLHIWAMEKLVLHFQSKILNLVLSPSLSVAVVYKWWLFTFLYFRGFYWTL